MFAVFCFTDDAVPRQQDKNIGLHFFISIFEYLYTSLALLYCATVLIDFHIAFLAVDRKTDESTFYKFIDVALLFKSRTH